MGGLNLGVMGRANLTGNGSGFSSSAPSGGTATEQGFGPGYTQQTASSGGFGSLLSSSPGSWGTWCGIGAVVVLLFIRHSLPN